MLMSMETFLEAYRLFQDNRYAIREAALLRFHEADVALNTLEIRKRNGIRVGAVEMGRAQRAFAAARRDLTMCVEVVTLEDEPRRRNRGQDVESEDLMDVAEFV